MINANELRIGNWFIPCLFDDEQLEPRPLKARDFFALSENPNWGKPIPLTEERLLNFGFENWDIKVWAIKREIFIYKQDGLFWYITHSTNKVCLQHVHQLQNLYFALKGEELILTQPL
jgi:hypothetical protein